MTLGRNVVLQFSIEDSHAGGVALVNDEIGQTGGEIFRVFNLGNLTGLVGHRLARIEEHVRDEVRFCLEELDVVAVAPRVGFPVNVTGLITLGVLPVCGELRADAAAGALVLTDSQTFHDPARHNVERSDLGQGLRIEILRALWFVEVLRRRLGGFAG